MRHNKKIILVVFDDWMQMYAGTDFYNSGYSNIFCGSSSANP